MYTKWSQGEGEKCPSPLNLNSGRRGEDEFADLGLFVWYSTEDL